MKAKGRNGGNFCEVTRWTQIFAKRREKNLKKLSFSSYSRRFESRVLHLTSTFRERSLIASSLRASLFSALFNRCIRHFQSVYSPIGEFYDRVNGIMLTKYDLWVNFDFHSVKWIKKVLTGIKKNLKVYFTKRSSIVRQYWFPSWKRFKYPKQIIIVCDSSENSVFHTILNVTHAD